MKRVTLMIGVAALFFVGLGACGGDGDKPGSTTGALTFWQDVAPIYNQRCVRCHQEGGIGPFRLDEYSSAKAHAPMELAQVMAGTMPSYFIEHDGSCGDFHDETTLSAAEKNTIEAWVKGGAVEGTHVTFTLPSLPKLTDAVSVATPSFSPVRAGGQLAEEDEYRCFPVDAPVTNDGFLTGYDVTPGDASIVHHVLAFIVDPTALASDGQKTNAAVMKALDDASPDRDGWPCFGAAGEGVDVEGVPVTWAPGQGVVEYPSGMGVPLRAGRKLVLQVHYNLAEPGSAGKTDSTTVHLRVAPSVERQLAFLLPDDLLDSLGNPTPDFLPPHQKKTSYTWKHTGRELGIGTAAGVDLIAVMPHMHQRGIGQRLQIGPSGALSCAAQLTTWNFHWQEFYFYKTPPHINPTTEVELTCDYNTLNDTSPVLPGWGTRNEMCLAVLMVALPAQ